MDGKVASFEQACANHADDPDRLDFMRNELVEYHKNSRLGSGLDQTAFDLALRQKQTKIQAQALISGDDLNGAENVIHAASGGYGKAARASGSAPNTGKTIAEDLNNPLNLKKVGAKGGGRDAFE